MVKLVYCFGKARHLSHEEFSRYWKEVHGPIGTRIPGLRRLVQSLVIQPDGAPPPPYDGMAELWFDDLEALAAARGSAEWRASTQDEAHFIDGSRTMSFISEERTIL